ncbi:MAG: histone deacetylase [Desulfobacterales bacterium]
MILFDDSQKESLIEFGIEIPVLYSRVLKPFEFLKSHEILGPKRDQWHIGKIDETINRDDLLRAHSGEYIEELFSAGLENEIINTFELIDKAGNYYRYNPHRATLPLTQLFDRILTIVAGTVQCGRVALAKGFCFAFSGGMHHGQYAYGDGFCMVNDIVIAIRKLQAEGLIRTAWVIDIDAHKGDGTAALTKGDDSITTLSIHMANGWPLDGDEYDADGKFNPSFTPSDIDIPMVKGEDDLYIPRLQEGLNQLDRWPHPDLALVVSGADPYFKDELPSTSDMKLSLAQLKERDLLTYNFLKERDIPRAYLMAGGYGESCWEVYAQFLEWALIENLNSKKI